MDRTRWGRIEEIFELAHAQPVEARQRFLAGACGADGTLRDEIKQCSRQLPTIARSPSNG